MLMKFSSFNKIWITCVCVVVQTICFGQSTVTSNSGDGVSFSRGSSAYIVAGSKTPLAKKIVGRLSDYISSVTHKPAIIVSSIDKVPSKNSVIILSSGSSASQKNAPNTSPEAFTITTKNINGHKAIVVNGVTDLAIKQGVQRVIIKSQQLPNSLFIPELNVSEAPWIPQREWTLCPWSPDQPRGVFTNPNADKRINVWLYSDQQIKDYVDMFNSFGFSGCQLMETVANYSILGSAEAARGRLKSFANSVKQNGQDVTLWVWAAQFNGYGWTDNSVTYTPQKGLTAFTDPKVRVSFEKYYKGYTEMAPYTDMLMTHFYDPGSLKDRADVFSYMRLLHNKFKAINPKVKLGVDFWASDSDSAYMKQLIDNGFGDALLLESGMPHLYPPGKREALHNHAKQQDIKMGIWGWHTVERESDQFPKMHVNARVLSSFYKQIQSGVDKIQHIQYWSEMEAYHLSNIFSMYASAQLLWNPNRDPDELLQEISEGIWGTENGVKVLKALKLIQDIRSGPTWDTYWSNKGRMPYTFGTDNPAVDKQRANDVLNDLVELKTDTSFVPKFPLPFQPSVFIEIILPNIRQIQAFADFRLQERTIREASKKGLSKDELTKLAVEAWKPIPEYNTWVGTFGQAEARAQEAMMRQLAKDLNIKVNPPAWLIHRDADRYLQRIQTLQKRSVKPVRFKFDDAIGRGEFYWSLDKIQETINALVETGSLVKFEDNTYQLANLEEYIPQ